MDTYRREVMLRRWDDLLDQLDHGHHPVARETRYTNGPTVRQEILDVSSNSTTPATPEKSPPASTTGRSPANPHPTIGALF